MPQFQHKHPIPQRMQWRGLFMFKLTRISGCHTVPDLLISKIGQIQPKDLKRPALIIHIA